MFLTDSDEKIQRYLKKIRHNIDKHLIKAGCLSAKQESENLQRLYQLKQKLENQIKGILFDNTDALEVYLLEMLPEIQEYL